MGVSGVSGIYLWNLMIDQVVVEVVGYVFLELNM